ncbi:MAG: CgeB family protein [Planctomycetota bacterium]
MPGIILSAPADRPYSWGPHLYEALRDIRPQAQFLDFRSVEDPNGELLRLAQEGRPALHIAWKGEVYRPETFRELRELGVYNVLWHPDETVPEWLPPLAKASDLFCTQYKGMSDAYRAEGIENLDWLLDGITPSFFQYTDITPEERERYTCEVITVGTVDRIPEYRKRLYALNRLIQEKFDVRWWGRKMSFRRNSLRDWFSPGRRAWGGGMVWNQQFAKACHCAKVFLTLPRRPEISGGLSNRAFWVTGIGTFTLTLYKEGIEEFFEPGKEIAVFHDHDEMVEKVRHYLAHDEEREAVAKAGQERTLREYTNQHLLEDFLERLAARGGPEV